MGALSASFQDLSEGLAVEYWVFMVALTVLVYFIQGCDHPWSVVYFREFWAIWTKSREFSIVLSQVRMVVIKMSKDPSSWLRSPSAGWVSVQGMGIYSISLWDAFSLLFFFFISFLGKCKECFSSHHWINYLRINWILFTVRWFYVINFFLNSHFKLEHCNGIENLCSFKSSSSPNCRNKIMIFGSIFWLSLLLHNGLQQNTHVLPRSLPSLNIITFPFITPILVEVKWHGANVVLEVSNLNE